MKIVTDIIFTFIELFSILYLLKNEKVSIKRKIKFIFIQGMFSFILTHQFYLNEMAPKIILTIALFTVFGVVILKLSLTKSLFYMGTGLLLLVLSELVVIQIAMILHVNPGIGFTIALVQNVISKILFITFIAVTQKIIADIGEHKLKLQSVFLFLISNVGYTVAAICIDITIISLQDVMDTTIFLWCSIAILFVLIINILFLDRYMSLKDKEKEQQQAIYEFELQAKYYENKLKEEENIKKIYHDLKNHLLILEETVNSEEEYLQNIAQIRKDIIKYEDYFRTGNKYLDIILRDKTKIAVEYNIEFESSIDMCNGAFMEALDISTIFGNLIDNAIEACKQINNGNIRYIKVLGKAENSLLAISIKNSKIEQTKKSIINPKRLFQDMG